MNGDKNPLLRARKEFLKIISHFYCNKCNAVTLKLNLELITVTICNNCNAVTVCYRLSHEPEVQECYIVTPPLIYIGNFSGG